MGSVLPWCARIAPPAETWLPTNCFTLSYPVMNNMTLTVFWEKVERSMVSVLPW